MPRVNLIHNGIMGNIEVNGKSVKTEVVPTGAYKISRGEDNVVYSVNPSIRIFAVRQQWSKWHATRLSYCQQGGCGACTVQRVERGCH